MKTRLFPTMDQARFLLSVLLALLLGLFIGVLFMRKTLQPSLSLSPDTRALVPTVRILGIQNGELMGETKGDVRVIAGDHPVLVESGGTFRISDSKVLTNVISIAVPAGMKFVASSRGTLYYPVDSAQGSKISPGNRVYFSDRDSAEKAGFKAAD